MKDTPQPVSPTSKVIIFMNFEHIWETETSSIGTRSTATQAAPYNDGNDDDDIFYDASDVSPLDNHYEAQA